LVELPNGNGNGGEELGIGQWGKWEWDLSFRWELDGMGMKSLKREGFGTKNLLSHISTVYVFTIRASDQPGGQLVVISCHYCLLYGLNIRITK